MTVEPSMTNYTSKWIQMKWLHSTASFYSHTYTLARSHTLTLKWCKAQVKYIKVLLRLIITTSVVASEAERNERTQIRRRLQRAHTVIPFLLQCCVDTRSLTHSFACSLTSCLASHTESKCTMDEKKRVETSRWSKRERQKVKKITPSTTDSN